MSGGIRTERSAMRRQEDEDKIRRAIRDEIHEYFKDAPFVVAMEEHFLHHQQMKECAINREEWMSNHNFVSEMRKDIRLVRRTIISRIVTWLTLFITGSITLAWVMKQLGFKFN
jgi:hypothetical protein